MMGLQLKRILIALILLNMSLPFALSNKANAQEASQEDRDPLEAEKFDDEFADDDFGGINDGEFKEIEEGKPSVEEPPMEAPPETGAAEGAEGEGEPTEDAVAGEGAEDLPADMGMDEEPVIDEAPVADQATPPKELPPAKEEATAKEEAPAAGSLDEMQAADELPGMEEGAPEDMPAMGDGAPQDPMMGAPAETATVDQASPEVVQEASAPPAYDAPDDAFENRLHEIYEKYNKMPISNEQWAEIAGEKTREIYQVLKGDSLWEISEMFFGDGNYWPKVWSFNSKITNPHLIEIDDRIMFYPGDEENAPQVVVESQAAAEEPPAQEQVVEEMPPPEEEPVAETEEALDIPQPTVNYPPPLRSIPPSLPEEKAFLYEGFDESGFAVSTKRFSKPDKAEMRLTSYIADAFPAGMGEVVEMMGGRQTAQLYEYVYIKVGEGAATGDVVTVIDRAKKGAQEKTVEFTKGIAIQYLGEVELKEVVNESQNIYRALVVSLVNQISLGSKIIPGPIPRVAVSNVGQASPAQAKVIGGEFDDDRKVLGIGSVVYLDSGSDAGIQPDQIVGVVANEKIRNEETKISTNMRDIGRIKIAKVEPGFSTGIVVYANEEISNGDYIGRTVAAVSSPPTGASVGDDGGMGLDDFGGVDETPEPNSSLPEADLGDDAFGEDDLSAPADPGAPEGPVEEGVEEDLGGDLGDDLGSDDLEL